MEIKEKKQPITENIRNLSLGEEFLFPIKRAIVVRQMIVNLQVISHLRFSTAIDREKGVIRVVRIA